MEISNPIASQYVMNQGLAAKLTSPAMQLPVKSERFAVTDPSKNKEPATRVPATTEDEQRLRSGADKEKQTSDATSSTENTNAQELLLASKKQMNPLGFSKQSDEQDPTQTMSILQQNNNIPSPIRSYLETSAMSSSQSGISSQVDFFV